MSKRITSFLVVAVALLLAMPAQAQLAKKRAKAPTMVLKSGPIKPDALKKDRVAIMKAKAAQQTEGQAFRGNVDSWKMVTVVEQLQEQKVAFEKLMEQNRTGARRLVNSISFGIPRPVSFTSTSSNTSRRAEAVDEHGIITAPAEGELKYYTRTGAAYYYSSGWSYTNQSGHAVVIECADGTVYIENPISRLGYGSYIKGTKNGNTITIPAGQPILYNASYDATIDVKMGSYSESGFAPNAEQSDIVFTIDGNTLTLEGTSSTDYVVLGGFWSDDNSMQSADSETVLTLDTEYTPASTDPVEVPAGLTTETWNTQIDGVVSTATIGFDNNDVYVKGLFTDFPNAWIKGTISGTTITFAKLQFVGTYQSYNIWATGYDSDNSKLVDFVMTYDAAAKVMTGSNLLLNAADDKLYYLAWYENVTIQEATFEEPTATTGANVDAPYTNALATADDFGVFGVIDSNKDGSTWAFDASYGAYYHWNSSNNANDWLISPAIKLEAGKKYHFAIDAACALASYPEKFEVKIGAEPKASALTQTVLEEVEVASSDYVTYENGVVEVAETGYYHFGIHATSDADEYRLMVKNFLVEAGVEADAPAAVTDLALTQTPNKLEAVVSFKAPTKTSGGADLTDLTKIEILRDGQLIKTFDGTAAAPLMADAAASASWVAADQGYENAQAVSSFTIGAGVSAALADGGNSNSPKYYTSGDALRMYGNNTMTLSGATMTKVVFTLTGNDDQTQLEANVGEYALDNKVGTWTGSASEIVFTVPTGKQARIQKIEIWTEGGGSTTTGLTPGAEYSYTDAEGLTIGTHVYQVIPYNAAGIGVKSEEKSIFLSVALEAPYTFDFSQNLLEQFAVIDNNADGKTWTWSASNGAYYGYSSANAADDYLITMPFNLKAGKTYNVIVNARSSGYDEKFEVKAGKEATVAGLTETVIAETTIPAEPNGEWDDYEGTFAPAEDGTYNFAIHATSDADMFNLCVKTLTVELAPEPTAPAAVADLNVVPGAEGALEAHLFFTAPDKAINGNALDGTVDVKVYRDNELINTLTDQNVGSSVNWVDTDVEGGTHTYYVVAANASGDGLKSEKVSAFIGEDELGAVAGIKVTGSTPTTISLAWDEVEGANGGYVNTANVQYAVVSTHLETSWFWQYLVVDDVIGTVTGATSGTFDYPVDEGTQNFTYFGVVAVTDESQIPATDDEYAGGYSAVLVGTPYEMPFLESFTGGSTSYDIWGVGGCETAYALFDTDASDDDYAVVITTYDNPGEARLESGKIKIEGANPTLLFDAKASGLTSGKVYASIDDAEWTVIATVDVTDEYQTVKVPLTNAKGQRFTRIAFGADVTDPSVPVDQDAQGNYIWEWHDALWIDNIKVVDLYEYNLTAAVKAKTTVTAGETAVITATVANEGEFAASGYTVKITAGEKEILNETVNDELAPFTKKEFTANFETSVLDEAGDVTIKAVVDYENELNPDDNVAEILITIKEPTVPAPATLTATDNGVDGVDLVWSMPAEARAAAAAVTEDFEDASVFEPFSLGGITADEHNGAFGDWTLYDGNGIGTYGFNGVEFENAYQPMAFIPFKPSAISETMASNYAPHSGDQFLISFCPVDENNYAPAADHWLISPSLSGDAQTISFYARAITAQYGAETFEVLASSTDNQTTSFTVVSSESTDATEWTEFTVDLPAGTKYFAIRHTAEDVFGLLIDDITYVPGNGAPIVPVSFNIYYDQSKLATVNADVTTYTAKAEEIGVGERTFAVTAVYAGGAESKPISATVDVVTSISQIAVSGKPVDVYTLDGKLIRRQTTSLDGLKGFYIINGKKVMVK